MQIRAFHIRLSKEHQHEDEKALNGFLSQVTVKKTASQFVTAQMNYWSVLVYYEPLQIPEILPQTQRLPDAGQIRSVMELNGPQRAKTVIEKIPLTEEEKALLEALNHWRGERAKMIKLPNYMICFYSELEEVVRKKPQTLSELAHIKGFGPRKIEKYGEEILAVLNAL